MANSRYVPRKQDGIAYEIYMILLSAEEPMTAYEVYRLLPEMNEVIDSKIIGQFLSKMESRGQIKKSKTKGWTKYCLIR